MPLSKYYGGHGEKVMADMKRRYGGEKGEEVFYATHNARKKKKGLTAGKQADALRPRGK